MLENTQYDFSEHSNTQCSLHQLKLCYASLVKGLQFFHETSAAFQAFIRCLSINLLPLHLEVNTAL